MMESFESFGIALTETDKKLIECAAADLSDTQIAVTLGLSKNAIEKRWAKLRKRFGVSSRSAIIANHFTQRSKDAATLDKAYLSLVDELPVALFAFDENRRVAFCNSTAARLLGVSISDLIGNDKIWREIMPGANQRERIRREFLDSLRDFMRHVTRIVRLDGSRVTVAWSSRARSHPIPPYHWWVIGQEIPSLPEEPTRNFSKSKAISPDLHKAHLQLEDEMPVFLLCFDENRCINHANRPALELFNLTSYEAEGDGIWRMVTPGASERSRITRPFIDGLSDFSGHKVAIKLRSGEMREVCWSSRAQSVPIAPYWWWVIGREVC